MFGRSMESVTQSFRNKSKTVSVQQSSESMETEEVPDVTLATEDIELDDVNVLTLEKTTFDDTKEPEPEKESRKEHEEIMTGIESIMKMLKEHHINIKVPSIRKLLKNKMVMIILRELNEIF